MKQRRMGWFLGCVFMLSGLSAFAYAEHFSNTISVTAEPQKVSVTTIGKNIYFSKEFNVLVINLGKETVNLSDGCFVGYDRSNRAYFVDIIDNKLTSTELEKQKSVQGMIVFSSDNEQVQSIQYVKFEAQCN